MTAINLNHSESTFYRLFQFWTTRTWGYLEIAFIIWRLICRSLVSDCGHEVCQPFDARYGIKNRCQTALSNPSIDHLMSCVTVFFWRHVWCRKADQFYAYNHLPKFGKRVFNICRAQEQLIKGRILCLGSQQGIWSSYEPLTCLLAFLQSPWEALPSPSLFQ